MPWIKLDDSFLTNAKILQAGLEARALYVAGLCYCGKTLSDGAIPAAMVPKLAALADVSDAASAAATLVALRLWHETPEGYEVHDYLAYNPTRQQAESNAAQRALSGQIGGRRSGEVRAARAKQNRSNLLHDGEHDAPAKQNRSKLPSKIEAKEEATSEANHEPVSRIPYPVLPHPIPSPHIPTDIPRDDPDRARPAAPLAPLARSRASQGAPVREAERERRAELVRRFEADLWPAWPLKRNRLQAQVAFVKAKPSDAEIAAMLAAIPAQSAAYDWPRENWRYVPYLSTWINQRRWEDEIDAPPPPDTIGDSLAWLKASRRA